MNFLDRFRDTAEYLAAKDTLEQASTQRIKGMPYFGDDKSAIISAGGTCYRHFHQGARDIGIVSIGGFAGSIALGLLTDYDTVAVLGCTVSTSGLVTAGAFEIQGLRMRQWANDFVTRIQF